MRDHFFRRPAALFSIAFLAGATLVGVSLFVITDDNAGAIELKPDDTAMRQQGSQIYAEACASCHGARLEGQPDWQTPLANGRYPAPPHNQDGHTWHHADELLFNLTKFGSAEIIGNGHQSDMPGFKDQLSDKDIIAVLSYIKSTWPKMVRMRHDRLNQNATRRKGRS